MSICNTIGQFAQHLNIQNTPTHPVRNNIIYKQSTFDTVYICHFIRSRHSKHQRPPCPHPRNPPWDVLVFPRLFYAQNRQQDANQSKKFGESVRVGRVLPHCISPGISTWRFSDTKRGWDA